MENPYADVDEKEEEYGIAQIIDDVLHEYYSEREQDVRNGNKNNHNGG